MMNATINNNAEFLLDGDEFFTELHKRIRDLLNAAPAANSYLRLAYWGFDIDTTLPGCTDTAGTVHPATTIKDLIKFLAQNGHIVQIILWSGAIVGLTMEENWNAFKAIGTMNTQGHGVGPYHDINIYMEPYKGKWKGYSTHQKITIITIAGTKRAFVGGFNMMEAYLGDDIHTVAQIGTTDYYTDQWHDTGVQLTGPIADVIEDEWVRRWNKQDGAGPFPNTAFAATPLIGGANTPITALTTNAEAAPIETDIRNVMIQRITAAQNLIYLENYALTDPLIVKAIAERQIGKNPPTIIIVVDHPLGREAFAYLMYYTYASLALRNFRSLTYGRFIPSTLDAANIELSTVSISGLDPNTISTFKPSKSYVFKYRLKSDPSTRALREIDFNVIKGITPQQSIMYAPKNQNIPRGGWTYPHSKLAIFDDQYTIIGTSNWTYRSMQYDGEIALEIDDQAFTTNLRNRLFTHWRQPNNPTQWRTRAAQNVADMSGLSGVPVPDGEVRMVPLEFTDFITPNSDNWRSMGTYLNSIIAAMF